jgi:hypothetical protein
MSSMQFVLGERMEKKDKKRKVRNRNKGERPITKTKRKSKYGRSLSGQKRNVVLCTTNAHGCRGYSRLSLQRGMLRATDIARHPASQPSPPSICNVDPLCEHFRPTGH